MLNNWLSPISKETFKNFKEYNRNHFAKKLLIHTSVDHFPQLSNAKMAIIGVDEEQANAVRKALYGMNYPFRTFRVADLGNARKKDLSFLIPIVKELLDGDIFPIIIGGDIQFSLAQYQAYQSRRFVNLTMVDERIRLTPQPKKKADHQLLNTLIKKRKPRLFHLSNIAFQTHFTNQKSLDVLRKHSFEFVRLGKVKNEMASSEPTIRDADLFCFNLSAVKAADAPAQALPTPSGLTSEEACQLSRYAGLSDKLTSAGFYGLIPEKDHEGRSAQVVAQMVWYLIDGFANRKNDYPASNKGLVEYIVEFKNYNHPFHFWKSTKTGRWWIQIPVKTKKKVVRHQLVPCTYDDYQQTCKEDVPERLLNAFKRFS